mmetsp:Transcript_23079/g.53534  ORF Transcript_23079/g.53534 Transcript_23079/m.53534 type:complete len:228 (-) Transcript_23079:461-1144(-)
MDSQPQKIDSSLEVSFPSCCKTWTLHILNRCRLESHTRRSSCRSWPRSLCYSCCCSNGELLCLLLLLYRLLCCLCCRYLLGGLCCLYQTQWGIGSRQGSQLHAHGSLESRQGSWNQSCQSCRRCCCCSRRRGTWNRCWSCRTRRTGSRRTRCVHCRSCWSWCPGSTHRRNWGTWDRRSSRCRSRCTHECCCCSGYCSICGYWTRSGRWCGSSCACSWSSACGSCSTR